MTRKDSGKSIVRRSSQAFSFMLLLLAGVCAYAEKTPVIIYADSAYPPYSYQEHGKVKGIYTEVLKRAFAQMPDYDVIIRPVPWKRGLSYIEQGTGFAIYPPYFHPTHRPWMSPYSEPILDENVVVFCRDDVEIENAQDWPYAYFNQIIGLNEGFKLGGEDFHKAIDQGLVTTEQTKSNIRNIKALAYGRSDCYINDRLAILWGLNLLKVSGWYDEGGVHATLKEMLTVSTEQGFVGYSNQGDFPYKADFIEKLNKIIISMKKNGDIDHITNRFIACNNSLQISKSKDCSATELYSKNN